jgi:hypothetical protein
MNAWERRLNDLAHLLGGCYATYMEPDLFRMNTNQFLQTARTVTFILQKNKAEITGFESWYKQLVDSWQADAVMNWARDARNTVEKEGDLELNSTLKLTLIFSYLVENDASVQPGRVELLGAGLKKLVRFAQKKLPTGIAEDAVVKIERRWVVAALPQWELVHAMSYVYARLHEACRIAATNMNSSIDSEIVGPNEFDKRRDESAQVRYFKLAGRTSNTVSIEHRTIRRQDIPADIQKGVEGLFAGKQHDGPSTFEDAVEFHTKMAETNFSQFGNHVPMLFFYDESWKPIDMISTSFDDRSDKYIFWRRAAERAAGQLAYGLGWVCESWRRNASGYPITPIGGMPIIGEQLHIVVADRTGRFKEVVWKIVRPKDGLPLLELASDEADSTPDRFPNFLMPIRRAWGLPDPPDLG